MNQAPEDRTGPPGDSHRLAAIVFADIVGSTATMEQNEKLALKNLARMREVTYPQVEAHAGKVIKELGDGFLAVFNSVLKAVNSSLAIQKGLQGEEDPKLRISIHIGDVVVEKGDVFGSGVNIASRMNSHAPIGGIAVSGDVWRQLQNKGDYAVRSLGLKEMKGVSEPMEVFELLESAQTFKKGVSLLQRLKRSRIPHYLIPYALGVWMVVQSTSWLANRYLLSPHLTNFIFTLLVTLIPTAFLLGYVRGHPGMKAKRYKKVGIPLNLALSGVLLFGLFRDKDLGSMMANVTLVNEEGQTIQRTIPKGEFRPKIIIYYFVNASGDTSLNWLQSGISNLLVADLGQGPIVDWGHSFEGLEQMDLSRSADYAKLPLISKKLYASKSHTSHFVYGNFTVQNGIYTIQTILYNTSNAKVLNQRTFKGKDLFNLIDEVTTQLKYDLKIPPALIEKTADLPVSEILTHSLPAFKMYCLGITGYPDIEKSMVYLEQAVKEDSTFLNAYQTLSSYYELSGQKEKAEMVLSKAMRLMYLKSERTQLNIKLQYYHIVENNKEKRIALLKMWNELYPNDIARLTRLAQEYRLNKNNKEALSVYNHILKINPEEYSVYLDIGDLYSYMRKEKEAIKFFQRYSNKFPDEYTPYFKIAECYRNLGEENKAKEYFEKVLLFYPDHNWSLLYLAGLEAKAGNIEKALKQYEDVLYRSRTDYDSTNCYFDLIELLELKGQAKKATQCVNFIFDYYDKDQPFVNFFPDFNPTVLKMKLLHYYIRAGQKDTAFQIAETLQNKLKKEDEIEAHSIFLDFYLLLQDTANAEKEVAIAQSLLPQDPKSLLFKIHSSNIGDCRAQISEMKGHYEEALTLREKAWGKPPSNDKSPPDLFLARCYRKLGKLKKAEEVLKRGLKYWPNIPKAHYELALVYGDMGKKDKAIEHLNKALYVWAEADTDYVPAKKAREKLAELQGGIR